MRLSRSHQTSLSERVRKVLILDRRTVSAFSAGRERIGPLRALLDLDPGTYERARGEGAAKFTAGSVHVVDRVTLWPGRGATCRARSTCSSTTPPSSVPTTGEFARGRDDLREFLTTIFAEPVTYGWTWDHPVAGRHGDVVWFVALAQVILEGEGAPHPSPIDSVAYCAWTAAAGGSRCSTALSRWSSSPKCTSAHRRGFR